MRSLRKFAAVLASVYNLFASERGLYSIPNFALSRVIALAAWRVFLAALGTAILPLERLFRMVLLQRFEPVELFQQPHVRQLASSANC